MPDTAPQAPEREGSIETFGATVPSVQESDATLDAAESEVLEEKEAQPQEEREIDTPEPQAAAEEEEEAVEAVSADEIVAEVERSLLADMEKATRPAAPDVELARREGALSEREKYLNEQIARLGEKKPEEVDDLAYLKNPAVVAALEQTGMDREQAEAVALLAGQAARTVSETREAKLREELEQTRSQITQRESLQENQRRLIAGLQQAAQMGDVEAALVKKAFENFPQSLVGQKIKEWVDEQGIKQLTPAMARDAVAATAQMIRRAHERIKAQAPKAAEEVEEVVEAGAVRSGGKPQSQKRTTKLTPEEEILEGIAAVKRPSERIPFLANR